MDARGIVKMLIDPATMPRVGAADSESADELAEESDSGYDFDRPIVLLRKR
jgi:hypothetical protein